MSLTSSPVFRFKMAFDVTGSDCQPKPSKFFAYEAKDGLVDIKGLKTRIQNKLAIDYDWDLIIDDIVVDDYLPVRIIESNEVIVIRRKPINDHSNEAFNRSQESQYIEVQKKSEDSVTTPAILATNRPKRKRSEKKSQWMANGFDGRTTTSGDEDLVQNSQSLIDENNDLVFNGFDEDMIGSQSDGSPHERSKRVRRPVKRFGNVFSY